MTQRCWRPTSWSGGSSSHSVTSCPSPSASWRSHWWASREATKNPTWRTASFARSDEVLECKWNNLLLLFLMGCVPLMILSFCHRLLCSWCLTRGTSLFSPILRTGYKTVPWNWSMPSDWEKPLTLSWSSECGSPTVGDSENMWL